MNTETLILLLIFKNMSDFWMITRMKNMNNFENSASGCCLAFA